VYNFWNINEENAFLTNSTLNIVLTCECFISIDIEAITESTDLLTNKFSLA
jgi:hypothetical protein